MAEITAGLRRILSLPAIYELSQRVLGSEKGKSRFISTYLGVEPGAAVLDIGCGPAHILTDLPDVRYVGFDPSPAYIRSAQQNYGNRGRFFVAGIEDVTAKDLGTFDLVFAKGVLHHLDDQQASRVCELARGVLAPGGKFVTRDPAFAPNMSRVARMLISRDRGQNVRTEEGYKAIADKHFGDVVSTISHDMMRVPYTHAILVCRP